jgi:methyltransferase-like protein/2-polyprenyl-3-methyl-5-hydroxy-6-metoxy-1,4-benzoquinol methylase
MTPYDELPYPSYAFPQTHPDRLATIATLLGLEPRPVDRCRVLEVGCASGGNLVPLAEALPRSTFVGIDLSAHQIAQGRATIAELGLANIQLHTRDLCAFGPGAGTFDYIIAHGVYSWVPPHVRDALLALVKHHLAPNGVAYISYNTYPGWHTLGTLRSMLRYHTRHAATPSEALDQADDLIVRFATLADDPHVPPSELLAACRAYQLHLADRASLNQRVCTYHDILAEVNDPCLFTEFAAHAARHGLQYLAEADFATVLPANLAPPVAEQLAELAGNAIEIEQYMDFVRGRTFRRTLVVHDHQHIERRLSPERLFSLAVASPLVPVSLTPDLAEAVAEQFRMPNGATLSLENSLHKAAMHCLARSWPAPLPFARLLIDACALLGDAAPSGEERAIAAVSLAAELLAGFCAGNGLVELHTPAVPRPFRPQERPAATLAARYQATHDTIVTNLRHECLALDDLQRALLPYLDGANDRTVLARVLTTMVGEGRLLLDNGTMPERDRARRIERGLDELLHWYGRSALLTSSPTAAGAK